MHSLPPPWGRQSPCVRCLWQAPASGPRLTSILSHPLSSTLLGDLRRDGEVPPQNCSQLCPADVLSGMSSPQCWVRPSPSSPPGV